MAGTIRPNPSSVNSPVQTKAMPRAAVAAPAVETPEASLDQLQTSPSSAVSSPLAARTIAGTTFQPSSTGGTLSAGNGLSLRQDGSSYQMKLPGGDQIVWTGQDRPMGVGAEGAFRVKTYTDKDGAVTGFSYSQKDGTEVSINQDDMSVVYQNKLKGVTQHLGPDGGQYIVAQHEYQLGGKGKIQKLEQKLYIEPDGNVIHLKGDTNGLKVSQTGLEFKNPSDWRVGTEFPKPIPMPLSGALVDRLATTPAPARGPVAAPGPVSVAAAAAPTNPVNWAEPYPTANNEVMTGSQTSRATSPDGSLSILTRNNIALLISPDKTAVAIDPRLPQTTDDSDALPVSVTPHTLPDGRVEHRFQFNDAHGAVYTMFDHSQDFQVVSGDSRVSQQVFPNGTIVSTVKGQQPGQVYRMINLPDGSTQFDPGIQMGRNPGTGDSDRVYMQGAGGQTLEVGLPYPIPGDIAMAGLMNSLDQQINAQNGTGPAPSGPSWPAPSNPAPGPTPTNSTSALGARLGLDLSVLGTLGSAGGSVTPQPGRTQIPVNQQLWPDLRASLEPQGAGAMAAGLPGYPTQAWPPGGSPGASQFAPGQVANPWNRNGFYNPGGF